MLLVLRTILCLNPNTVTLKLYVLEFPGELFKRQILIEKMRERPKGLMMPGSQEHTLSGKVPEH